MIDAQTPITQCYLRFAVRPTLGLQQPVPLVNKCEFVHEFRD